MDIRLGTADDLRRIRAFTHGYTDRNDFRALFGFLLTLGVYLSGLIGTIWALSAGQAIWLPLWAGLAAVGIIRLYVIQHDCGHLSHFSMRRWNVLAGHVASLASLSPFTTMQFNHNRHHSHVGDLAHREDGEVHTMTLREWQEAGAGQRLFYRLYRNPFIIIPLGALFTYFIRYRWPKNTLRVGWAGVVGHNIALALWLAGLWSLAGAAGLWAWFGTAFLAGMLGVFQVYLQHNFEDTYWSRRPDLDPQLAALQGSSALDLGWLWDLCTGNIAYHDLHHFNPRIPLYNLRRCHFDLGREMPMRRIGWGEALRAFRLKLWDEDAHRLVPFPAAETARQSSIPAE